MKFTTALRLSFNNIRTKKGELFNRLCFKYRNYQYCDCPFSSTGFQKQIDKTQSETLAQFPITISKIATDQDPESFNNQDKKAPSERKEVTAKISDADRAQHTNLIDQKFIDYVNHIDPELSNNIGYTRLVNMNLLREINGKAQAVKFSNDAPDGQSNAMASMMAAQTGVGVSAFPKQLENGKTIS